LTRVKILFVRDVRRPTGGNIKVRDYFFHALAHPGLDARIWFAPGSRHDESDIWAALPADRIVPHCDFDDTRLVCINGKDWRLLPKPLPRASIVHFLQHGGHATDPELRTYLRLPAHRLCTSAIVHETILPDANGPSAVVPLGIDDAFFEDRTIPQTVLILGRKQMDAARALHAKLARLGVNAELLLDEWHPRAEFARRICEADVLVTFPSAYEGFYLPPLEGMAAGCVIICSNAGGNSGHCIPDETCLQPPHGDVEAHAAAVLRALRDGDLRTRLRGKGRRLASFHTLAAERSRFHEFMSAAIAAS
jgi:glycosyltransferase involved in cell wall biosynthesis